MIDDELVDVRSCFVCGKVINGSRWFRSLGGDLYICCMCDGDLDNRGVL